MSRGALASLLYLMVVRLGTVGLSVAVARIGGAREAGALGVALQVVGLVCLFATFNLPQGLTQRLSNAADPDARRTLLRTSAGMIAVSTSLAGIALLLGAPFFARALYSDASLTQVLRACGPLILTGSGYLWVEGAMQGLRRFGDLALWGTIVAVVDLGADIVAARWGAAAVIAVRAVIRGLAVAFAARMWLLRRATPGIPENADSGREAAISLFGFAGPALLASGLLMLGQTLLRLFLVRISGLQAAGEFQAADSIAQGLTLVPLAAAAAFMPAMAAVRRTGGSVSVPLGRALQQVTGYHLPLCLAAIGLGRWAVPLLFGHEFASAGSVFVVLAVAYGFVGPSTVFGAWLMGLDHVWTLVAVNAGWSLAVLGLFHFGLASWGALGAAAASAATFFLALAIYALVVARRHALPASSYGPPVAITTAGLLGGATLSLAPAIPVAVGAAVNVIAAAFVFLRWGLPSLSGITRARA